MSGKRNVLIAAAVAALLGAGTGGVAFSQTQAGTTVRGAGPASTKDSIAVSEHDKQFMKKAAQAGMAEVEEGRIASEKTQDPAVKAFAERMVQDHSQANDKLMQIAQTLNVTLPAKPSEEQQKHLSKLRKLSRAQFDKSYDPMQVKDHQKTVSEFEREAKDVKNPALKEWVDGTLPVLKEHLKLAEALPNTG